MDDHGAALAAIVGADHVETVPGPAPGWRVHPGTPPEVAELVAMCATRRLAVVPVGSGSRPAPAGARPRVQIGTRRLTHVSHLDETSLVAHVQAGITGIELEQILVPRGLSIGDYPP